MSITAALGDSVAGAATEPPRRRARRAHLVLLGPGLVYLVLFFVFQGVGRRGAIPPVVAAFLPDLILLGTAALLLRTAGRT